VRICIEVVDRDLLAREQDVSLQGAVFLLDSHLHGSGRGLATLLCILTSSAERTMRQLGRAGVEASGSFGCGQDPLAEQPLDALHADVSKLVMPT